MLKLETERLLLRPFTTDDFEAGHSYGSDPENVKYMVWGPNDENATRAFLNSCEEKWKADPIKEYEFAIVLKSTGKVIGGCGIYLNNERNTAMLGWILNKGYWKQGYMPEAAAKLLEYCFNELKLHRVYSTCNTENYGSFRVMEKIGMRREAHFIKNNFGRVWDKEIWYDEYHYAILEEEWEKRYLN